MTILEQLTRALRQAATYNRHDQASPSVILWTDAERLWEPAAKLVAASLPEFLILDEEVVEPNRGPSTWLRYRLSRSKTPNTSIVYVPGISRSSFRSATGFPERATHLFALQFQGQFWAQTSGKDWTPSAFLSSENGGLGFTVSADKATLQALRDQLVHVLQTPSSQFEGKTIDAALLHGLVARDPHRMLLQWLADPPGVKSAWTLAQWSGFVTVCKQQFGLDPEKDGNLEAAERLASGKGKWEEAWARFVEAPTAYPGVRDVLARVELKSLLDKGNDRLPATNQEQERLLREGLLATASLDRSAALAKVATLSQEHVKRAGSVWAVLGEAPLALAAKHLAELTVAVRAGQPGGDWADLSEYFTKTGWRADAAAWRAFAAVRDNGDIKAVAAALRAVYLPWLESLAEKVRPLASSYPNKSIASTRALSPGRGSIIVFVDGLRWDLAQELLGQLKSNGLDAKCEPSWSPMPTVTATAKPAWRPFTEHAHGVEVSATFEPQLRDGGRAVKAPEFRGVLEELGWQCVEPSSVGDPTGIGWTEAGSVDRYGHDDSTRLPWHLAQELETVCARTRELFEAGWKTVILTTDHGWLYLPGGLPKVDLPSHLTVSKWGRCAVPLAGAQHNFPQVPWFWGGEHTIVLAPGISVFRGGIEYAHGGMTLQECVIPTITITKDGATASAPVRIESIKWVGLRLQVQLTPAGTAAQLDIRTRPAAADSSILSQAQRLKVADAAGKASLTVEDDDRLGQAAVLVVLVGQQVVAKQAVTIGED